MKYTKAPWVAVQYANFWNLQKEGFYSDTDNLLDEDKNIDAEANAKLAAAAPELLHALIKLKQWVGKLEDWKGIDPPTELVDNAINKAIE